MKALGLRTAALALAAAAASTFLFPACAPECVDFADCADKAKAANQEFTCDNGVCKAGSPFPDAGETGGGTGGGDTGGGTGGGATGGGGGGGGATGGGGGDMDAGTDAGTDDAGTDDAGMDLDAGTDAGTDLDAGTDDAGTVTPSVAYVASLSAAQAVPPSASAITGTATFAVSELVDGGYNLAWNVTYLNGGGGMSGGLRTNWAGFVGPDLLTFASFASPIMGNQDVTPAQASDVAGGKVYVWLQRQGNQARGQIIPEGNSLWTSQMNTSTPGATLGGAQFVVPADGGLASCFGIWTDDVVATDAHIHQGGVGGTGAPIVPLTVGADAGTFAGTFDPATLAAGDTDGGLYVNVHTTAAPNGLIRGQLVKH